MAYFCCLISLDDMFGRESSYSNPSHVWHAQRLKFLLAKELINNFVWSNTIYELLELNQNTFTMININHRVNLSMHLLVLFSQMNIDALFCEASYSNFVLNNLHTSRIYT